MQTLKSHSKDSSSKCSKCFIGIRRQSTFSSLCIVCITFLKKSLLFLVFACLFLLVHIHSPIEQKNVPPRVLKAIPSAFCCDNREPNCTLFQANNQKTSPHTLLWRWLLRSFHTFQPREEVSTHHICLLCRHLRTFHPQVTENDLGFFVFLNTRLHLHQLEEDDAILSHEN